MGRILLIMFLLLSSINTAKQHMFKALRLPYKQIVYASLLFAMMALSGCATTSEDQAQIKEAKERHLERISRHKGHVNLTCYNYSYGSGYSTMECQ